MLWQVARWNRAALGHLSGCDITPGVPRVEVVAKERIRSMKRLMRGRRAFALVSLLAMLTVLLAACSGSSVDTDDMPAYAGSKEIGKAEASDEDSLPFKGSDGKGVVLTTKDPYATVLAGYGAFNADGWTASSEPVDALDRGFVELKHEGDKQVALVLITEAAAVKADDSDFEADDFDIDVDKDIADDDTVIYIVQVGCDEASIDACVFFPS